jgi:hypothetical protein
MPGRNPASQIPGRFDFQGSEAAFVNLPIAPGKEKGRGQWHKKEEVLAKIARTAKSATANLSISS